MTRTTDDPGIALFVQQALREDGLYEGEMDGVYGPVSEAAYQSWRAFQRYAGIAALTETLSDGQRADLVVFLRTWTANRAAYLRVGAAAKIPAELVAAIHWRESDGDFSTYLHNGDPLGRPTVHEPKGILFTEWEPAAVDALTRETAAYALSAIEDGTCFAPCLCVFAEAFNGEGYAERGVPDPYILAGTSGYHAGKFTGDGTYDPDFVDPQVGILTLLRTVLPATADINQAMGQLHGGGA